jgi:hypothetical protein
MIPSNCNLTFFAQSNLATTPQKAWTQSVERVSLLAALLALAFFLIPNAPAMAQTGLLTAGPLTPQSTGGILINNMNGGGVQPGLAANLGTVFTLAGGAKSYNISQIVTYHWDNGRGAPAGGTITIETYQQVPIRTFNVVVEPASGGVMANWVANINPPLQLGPGIYIAKDSGYTTWSSNSGSAGCLWFNPSFQCGFVRISGSATLPPPVAYNPSPSGTAPTSTTALSQSRTRPDLRAYGGCAPAPFLPTCNVNVIINAFTNPNVYAIITQTLESPGTTAADLDRQAQTCARQGGRLQVTRDAYYFYSSNITYNPGDQWAAMVCLR